MEEDTDIDILRADDSYPRRPYPIITIPDAGQTEVSVGDDAAEAEVARAVKAAAEVLRWVSGPEGLGGDGDTWEGFYISLDLVTVDSDQDGALEE